MSFPLRHVGENCPGLMYTLPFKCTSKTALLPSGCDRGWFGERCRHQCDCGGAPCDHETGKCLCPPGKTGDKCGMGKGDISYGLYLGTVKPI